MPLKYEGACVGGPWDRRRVTALAPVIDVPNDPPPPFRGALTPPRTRKHQYRHVQLWAGIGLWVHEALSIPDALASLVRAYEERNPYDNGN